MRNGIGRVAWLLSLVAILLGAAGVAAQAPGRSDAAPETAAAVVEIVAGQDAYIASSQPDATFGGTDALFIGYVVGAEVYGATRTLLQFGVEGVIPENATVISATLELYLRYAEPPGDMVMKTEVRRLAAAWDEAAVTWNTEPEWDGTLPPVEAEVGSELGLYGWDLTAMVRSWVAGEHPNYGLWLQGDETPDPSRERVFYSREAEVGDELKPRLVVEYVVDETPPVATVNPLPPVSPPTFTVSWMGDDGDGAGIAYYDVQYRVDGGEWELWQNAVTVTEPIFAGMAGHVYEFEARAVDVAGNVEPFNDLPEAATTTVPVGEPRLWLPIVLNQ